MLRLFLRFAVERSGHRTEYEAHDHAALAPLFSLLRTEVVAAETTADLGFRLELSGGWRLMAGSLHEMDYWELLYPCPPPGLPADPRLRRGSAGRQVRSS